MSRPRIAGSCFRAVSALLFTAALALAGGCEESVEPSLSVVAFGDWGTGDDNQQAVADGLAGYCKREGCDVGWLLGDNFYPAGVTSVDDPQWDAKFVEMYGELDIPFYVVLGNHDYGAGQAGVMSEVAYSELNPRWIMPDTFNVFETDRILVLGLDTTRIGQGDKEATDGQATVFSGAIGRSNAWWRIALGHHPYISDGAVGNAGNYSGVAGGGALVKAFYEQVLCGKVDVFLAGHDHNLQVLEGPKKCRGTFVIAGGGGQYLHGLPARDGNSTKFSESTFGFAHLMITRKKIRLRLVDQNGDAIYGTTLRK